MTLPIRGQLDAVGPAADQDAVGAYPLTVSVHRDAAPALLHQLVTAIAEVAAEERWARSQAAEKLLAEQLAHAYDWLSLAEVKRENPDRAAEHREAAEALWPWLLALPRQERHQAFVRGWEKAKENAAAWRAKDATLAEQHLQLATELRVPCPAPDDPGRPDGAPALRPLPLILSANPTGRPQGWEDGWCISNPNLEPGTQVWTGHQWRRDGDLAPHAIYRYTREEAVAEAQRLAVEESARYGRWIAEQRRPGPDRSGLAS
ncbi:hypothetical protein [Kitasatospora cineracea]|uniref:Uncharacterized protein n=1 Tax=Kitasatospora cineracea TaxID=88074 RepID=A0A3N4R450_9ACTN|nr:hypothetical protein [Kitasatospora cineracea]RPE27376.1 hypothetical protein EDD38_7521 [Kitasatospora cineracea]